MALSDRYYLHFLNCFPGFGPQRLKRLINYFPDYASAFAASAVQLVQAGIEQSIIEQWFEEKNEFDIKNLLTELETHDINLLTYTDVAYPEILRHIPQPPPLLYYRGKLPENEELCVAVVGTRKISAYGRSILPELVAPLVASGITIVSGLAYGVDSLAHQTTVDAGGRTIAVLGCGLDDATIYPQQHLELAHEIIAQGGMLLSEYPPGRPALAQHFVARNRIISGLSRGVLVVECDLKSGALLTTKHAKDQDREIYAAPGSIFSPMSEGPHKLIKNHAQLVTSGQDILDDLQVALNFREAPRALVALTEQEKIVLGFVSKQPVLVDDLLVAIPLPAHVITAALTFLEIKGCIKNVGAQQYVKK